MGDRQGSSGLAGLNLPVLVRKVYTRGSIQEEQSQNGSTHLY